MDTDKLIFGIIGGITLLVIGVIIATSFKVDVDITSSTLIGEEPHYKRIDPNEAKLVIVEFSDFECPACARYAPLLKDLVQKYPKRISVVYRHFPLPSHKYSLMAAKASEAAAMQNKFWEYHDILFANQESLNNENLFSYAKELGLNVDLFRIDLESEKVAQKVQSDLSLSKKLQLNYTPSIYFIYSEKVEKVSLEPADFIKRVQDILGDPIEVEQNSPEQATD